MTNKEIQELKERIYNISYSGFPLDSFFNDIEQNDNPRFNKDLAYKDIKLIVDEIYKLKVKAKKYDEKEKSPTIKEVKKEWEELGYDWKEDNYFIYLKCSDKYAEAEIIIKKYTKTFFKEDGHFEMLAFNFVEHQLLTKTFKALGWL